MAEPIAPPNVQDSVEVAVPAANNALPSGLAEINNAVSTGGQDPKANLAASNAIQAKIAQDEGGHINTQAQWGSVVANLLMRNYVGALNAYNGGQTQDIEGRTASGQKFYKQYNARGYTGKMYDVEGKELSGEQQKQVEENMGGVWTPRDTSVMNSGLFKGLQASELSRVTGLSEQVVGSMKRAYDTSQTASRMNQGITELEGLTKKLGSKLDLIKNAPPEIREGIFRFKTGQQATAAGQTTGEGKTTSQSATQQKTGTVGGGAGTKLTGGKVSATDTRGGTAGAATSLETGTTSSKSVAGQEDINSKIMGYIQKNVQGEEAGDLMRWVQLTQMVNESQFKLEQSPERAPGVVNVPPTELGLSDTQSAFNNTINLKRNNALESAWSSFVSHNVRTGRQNIGADQLREEFMNSNTYKGIQSMYDHDLEANKTGKVPEVKEGTIHVDNRNRPVVYRDGKWEPMNVR